MIIRIKAVLVICLLLMLNACATLTDESMGQTTAPNAAQTPSNASAKPQVGVNSPNGSSTIKNNAGGYAGYAGKSSTNYASQTNQAEVIKSLLATAKKQRDNKQYANATATLDRAVRISPKDPEPFKQLAEVRFEQAKYTEAEQMARKALLLAGTQGRPGQRVYSSDYLADLWDIVAESRSRLGDRAGANKARDNAADLRAN